MNVYIKFLSGLVRAHWGFLVRNTKNTHHFSLRVSTISIPYTRRIPIYYIKITSSSCAYYYAETVCTVHTFSCNPVFHPRNMYSASPMCAKKLTYAVFRKYNYFLPLSSGGIAETSGQLFILLVDFKIQKMQQTLTLYLYCCNRHMRTVVRTYKTCEETT